MTDEQQAEYDRKSHEIYYELRRRGLTHRQVTIIHTGLSGSNAPRKPLVFVEGASAPDTDPRGKAFFRAVLWSLILLGFGLAFALWGWG